MELKQKLMDKAIVLPIEHAHKIIGGLGIASIAMGAYHGYCDSKAIPVGDMEVTLKYWPIVANGAFGTYFGGASGFLVGVLSMMKRKGSISSHVGTGAAIGGAAGAGLGALETVVGYGVGYLFGGLM